MERNGIGMKLSGVNTEKLLSMLIRSYRNILLKIRLLSSTVIFYPLLMLMFLKYRYIACRFKILKHIAIKLRDT